MRENYDCDVSGCPAGYDGLHPNVLGKYTPKGVSVTHDFVVAEEETYTKARRVPDCTSLLTYFG
jgi:hypothetical protein